MFATPEVFTVFNANQFQGYETRDAIIRRTRQLSQVVKRFVVPHVAEPGLVDEDKQQSETCLSCGLTKYLYHKRGYMHLHRQSLTTEVDFQLTHEWFGSGSGNAFREYLVSQRAVRVILEQGWRGVTLKPVKLI